MGVTVGDRVTLGHGAGERQATVVAIGRCGWGRCKHGNMCVTVQEDGLFTTTNYSMDSIRTS